jgi:hypothetical protein
MITEHIHKHILLLLLLCKHIPRKYISQSTSTLSVSRIGTPATARHGVRLRQPWTVRRQSIHTWERYPWEH